MGSLFTQSFLDRKISEINKVVEIVGAHFNQEIEISTANFKCRGIIFKDCQFYESFHAIDCNIKASVQFYNCHFYHLVEFSDLKSNMEMIDQMDSVNLRFDGVTFEKELLIKDCHLNRDIQFKHTVFNGLIHISLLIGLGSIRFNTSKINSSLVLENCSAVGIDFYNVKSFNSIRFLSTNASSLSFRKSMVIGNIMFFGGRISEMNFSESEIQDFVEIKLVSIPSLLFLNHSSINRGFKVDLEDSGKVAELNNITINSTIFNHPFVLEHNAEYPQKVGKVKVKSISQSSMGPISGEIIISNIETDKLLIEGINNYFIQLKNLWVGKLQFKKLTNNSVLRLDNVNGQQIKSSCVSFDDAMVGELILNNFDFHSFKSINIQTSDLTKVKANNVKWFLPNDLVTDSQKSNHLPLLNKVFVWLKNQKFWLVNLDTNDIKVLELKNRQEIFRQLKLAMLAQGNKIQSLTFNQYEVKDHYKIQRLTKRIWNNDRLILSFSSTNRFGQNWILPLFGWLLPLTLFLFYPLMLVEASMEFVLVPSFNLNNIIDTFSMLYINFDVVWRLLNPTHSVDTLFADGFNKTSFLYFLDILYKIVYAFFVFQTITAFRKYIKT